jgi:NAD(P)-dependent dehydrogenase (short-subunit alcohol dehydrogenase family)
MPATREQHGHPARAAVPVAVVGAGPGIGAATARRFAAAGHLVAVVGRNRGRLDALVAEIEAAGGRAQAFTADIADRAATEAAFAGIRAALGDPGVLVFNAFVPALGLPSEIDPALFAAQLSANVTGALVCVQQVIPAMRAAGHGTLLLTGGGLALDPYPEYAPLAVSKAGQRNLFQSLAKELAPAGIHVAMLTVCGIVAPGTRFAAELMAEQHWQLHAQPAGAWETEIVVR